MKRLMMAAALLAVATAANAGETYSFDIGGRTIRIDKPRDCDDVSCISLSIPGVMEAGPKRGKAGRKDGDDSVADRPGTDKPEKDAVRKSPAPVGGSDQTASRPAAEPAAPATSSPPAPTARPDTATTTASRTSPAEPSPVQQPEPSQAPAAQNSPAPTAPAPAVVATAPAGSAAAPVVATDKSSPVGLWWTEEKEGRVRIEACGASLCGYSVKSGDANGEKILINMKPATDKKWKGRIHDPKSGSDYDSTIALKGTDELRVQGCAFGGMFCGGQTWTRIN